MNVLKWIIIAISAMLPLFCVRQILTNKFGKKLQKNRFKEAAEKSIAVIVCCNNEQQVIGRLLTALKNQTYKSFRVFVVAHNCKDNTADIARSYGAEVIVHNNPAERTKADALNRALKHIKEHYYREFDYITIFDADSVPNKDFLTKINNAMATGCDVASGAYDYINYNNSFVSKLSAGLYISLMKEDSLASFQNGLPVNCYGSGICVRYKMAENGWNTRTLTEDFEFTVREVLNDKTFIFVEDAIFKAEMPDKLRDALRQRQRWAVGQSQCFRHYWKAYLKKMKKPKMSVLKQFLELCLYPMSVVCAAGVLGITVWAVITENMFWIWLLLAQSVILYFLLFLMVYDAFSYAKMDCKKNLSVLAVMPFWVLITIVCNAAAFFIRNIEWKSTEHKGTTDK